MSSKKADQILKRLQGEGLIAKDKPATEKKKFKGYNKNKPKGKFGKPANNTGAQQKAQPAGNTNTNKANSNNGQKKHFHNKKRPSNQSQLTGKQQQTQPNKKQDEVVDPVAVVVCITLSRSKKNLIMTGHSDQSVVTDAMHVRVTKTGKAIRPAGSSTKYPDAVMEPFEPRGTQQRSVDPIRFEVREEFNSLQVVELPAKASEDGEDYVPTEEHSDHGEENDVFIGIKAINMDFSSTLVGGGTKKGSTKKRKQQLQEAS